ncbi:phytase [Mycena filopes]|nr:phytase [Mycena filopes]
MQKPRTAVLFATVWLGAAWFFVGRNWMQLNGPLLVQGQPEFDPRTSWGAYSPFIPVEEYLPPPNGCEITQLQRHGARFPTSGASINIVSAVRKLQSVKEYTHGGMEFLRSFVYTLGTDDLVPSGAIQSFEAGSTVFERYAHLVTADNAPFVRASSGKRVVDSANNWTAGFSAASHHRYNPSISVILSQEGNNTLKTRMCPNAGKSDASTSAWLAVPFCALFTPPDFAAFDYSADLDKYYYTGYGAARGLGRVQGVGYVNELLARLTHRPVRDQTQTNTTLDADPATFPLDRSIYADFSHDNTMVAIFAALGLFPQDTPLSTAASDARRTWHTREMVPFSGRMVVERLRCGDRKEYVRILVNDAVQPSDFCATPNDLGAGLCTLPAFVESQAYARSNGGGDWEECFS